MATEENHYASQGIKHAREPEDLDDEGSSARSGDIVQTTAQRGEASSDAGAHAEGDESEVMPQHPGKKHKSGHKAKSKKQVGKLLGKGSPLSGKQQAKLKRELHSGRVKVKK